MLKHRYILFISIILFAACLHNKKSTVSNTDAVSINKVWEFERIDTVRPLPKNTGAAWIGKNILDLTNKDTLLLKYGAVKNKPTPYRYSIKHDTIFIGNRPFYKILQLTDSEMHLLVGFKKKTENKALADSTIMVYKVKE